MITTKDAPIDRAAGATLPSFTLPEELILMLLNEESGYFHQVPGWNMNCALVGAAIAELSFIGRIDSDMDSLILLDATETGNPNLDPILREIAAEPQQHNARFWIERLAPQAESIVHQTLERLVEHRILRHHPGEFWTLTPSHWQFDDFVNVREGTVVDFVKARLSRLIFKNEIPDPRDVVIVCLADTCDVLRFIFDLDEQAEERIRLIAQMDLIGRAIADAVAENIAAPALRHVPLTKPIPNVPMREMIFNRNLREGNLSALFAELAEKHGPVYRLQPPFRKPMTILAGPETNHWAHRYGRTDLRAGDYLQDFEKVYGADGILPALDGTDHFRLRKSLQPAYSRARLEDQIDSLFDLTRSHMAAWKVGDARPAPTMSRELINAQISPLMIGVESQDLIGDLSKFKERALLTHLLGALPKFMLKTPSMQRKARNIDVLVARVQGVHTPAQRAGCPLDLADDLLSIHASDPQFLPEANLRFAFSAALIASIYLGDGLSFALYAMLANPDIYERIRAEADALFDNRHPDQREFTDEAIDVTRRHILETLRVYPIVPMSWRTVVNSAVVEGYELPVGTEIYIAQTAAHYMPDVFPEPRKFDIDRYLPDRREDLSPGYAPFGLGTHTCLGGRWMELQLAVNLLLLAHHFDILISPDDGKMRMNPFPSLSISKKIKFEIAGQRRPL